MKENDNGLEDGATQNLNIKPSRNKKHCSRALAVQAMYHWSLHPCSSEELIANVVAEHQGRYSKSYLNILLPGALTNIEKIDAALTSAVDRSLTDISLVELAVLRLAVFEFLFCLDVPAKVVVNEALDLSKEFGVPDGYKYVNAILDKLRRQLRDV